MLNNPLLGSEFEFTGLGSGVGTDLSPDGSGTYVDTSSWVDYYNNVMTQEERDHYNSLSPEEQAQWIQDNFYADGGSLTNDALAYATPGAAASDAEWDAWYEKTSAAIANGDVSLNEMRDADVQDYALAAYLAGDYTAEQAQEIYDLAYYNRFKPGQEELGTGRTTNSYIDENGNYVTDFAGGDGFVSARTTRGRYIFGEDDASRQGYLGATGPQNEQFKRGFFDGFMATPFAAIATNMVATALTGPLAGLLVKTGLSQAVASQLADGLLRGALGAMGGSNPLSWQDALAAAAGPLGLTDFIGDNADVLDQIGDDAMNGIMDIVRDEMGSDDPTWQGNDASGDDAPSVWTQDEDGNWVYDPTNIQVQYPDYASTEEEEDGGSTDAASDSSSDASSDASADSSDSSDSSSDSSGGEDSSADNGVGGDADDQSGDILGRQIHEAILKETDPEVRDRLIREWEEWTGEVWDEGYYDDKPFDPDEEREPIGHIWIPGDSVEGGLWWPIYNESDIPSDGTFVRGSTKPTTPPKDSTEGTTDAGITDGTTGEPVPAKGTALGEECLPNGDKEIYTADGEGGVDTEVVRQGCVEGTGTGGGLLSGGLEPCPEGYSRNQAGNCVKNVQGDMGGDSGSSDSSSSSSGGDSIDELCSRPRPETYGFDQIYWDNYCGEDDASSGGSDSGGDQSGSDSGGDQSGSSDSGGDSGGDSVDSMCSNPRPEEYGFAQINWDKYCGDGQGTGDGDGTGDGSGDGDGTGDGDGGDMSGLMSGSAGGSPTWGSLFGYTTLTPYQKRTLAPYVDYIKQAKGMLS